MATVYLNWDSDEGTLEIESPLVTQTVRVESEEEVDAWVRLFDSLCLDVEFNEE